MLAPGLYLCSYGHRFNLLPLKAANGERGICPVKSEIFDFVDFTRIPFQYCFLFSMRETGNLPILSLGNFYSLGIEHPHPVKRDGTRLEVPGLEAQVNAGAEREGFEPPTPCGIRDFESRAFVHSAISPYTSSYVGRLQGPYRGASIVCRIITVRVSLPILFGRRIENYVNTVIPRLNRGIQ